MHQPLVHPLYLWQLKALLLDNPIIFKDCDLFFCKHVSVEISPFSVWAAHKAAIMGNFFQIASRAKHNREATIKQQEGELAALLLAQKQDPIQTYTAN